MPGRRRKRKDAEAVAENAATVVAEAGEVAEESKEAVRDFAETTGEAAKEFATAAFDAAKSLLETVERAGETLNAQTKPTRRRGRKLFRASLALGAGVALFTSDTVRNAVSGTVDRLRGGGASDDPWGAPTDPSPDGQAADATTSETTS